MRGDAHRVFLSLVLTACCCDVLGAQPRLDRFDFGKVSAGDRVEHTFHFDNSSAETLEIQSVQLQPPLVATKGTARVAPGEQGSLTVAMGTPRKKGEFRGQVVVNFKNAGVESQTFWMIGEVVPAVEFGPRQAFYLAAQRGQVEEASLDITNHETAPLDILQVEHTGARFSTELETVKAGYHYRLRLTLHPDVPAGKTTEVITLRTASASHPVLEVPANIWIKDPVYSFPDVVDFGRIQALQFRANPKWVDLLTQQLMVYQVGGKDFQISLHSDVPFLELSAVRSPFKDRYQIAVSVVPGEMQPGDVRGSIIITTNDPQFPRLVVPVTAIVEW